MVHVRCLRLPQADWRMMNIVLRVDEIQDRRPPDAAALGQAQGVAGDRPL